MVLSYSLFSQYVKTKLKLEPRRRFEQVEVVSRDKPAEAELSEGDEAWKKRAGTKRAGTKRAGTSCRSRCWRLLREISQRQTLMFHFIREIHEETRLPIKLVREIGEDEYLARQQTRQRGALAKKQQNRKRKIRNWSSAWRSRRACLRAWVTRTAYRKCRDGYEVTCMRCGYGWVPRIAYPTLCAKCNAPWWYAPRWRWHRKLKPATNKSRKLVGRKIK